MDKRPFMPFFRVDHKINTNYDGIDIYTENWKFSYSTGSFNCSFVVPILN